MKTRMSIKVQVAIVNCDDESVVPDGGASDDEDGSSELEWEPNSVMRCFHGILVMRCCQCDETQSLM